MPEIELVVSWPVVIVLGEFLAMGLLGYICLKLLSWEMALHSGRSAWISQMRTSARQLRRVRMELQRMDWPAVPLKWRLLSGILRAVEKSRFGSFLQASR